MISSKEQRDPIQTSDIINQKSFTMESSSESFHILSNLYTVPERAVVREIFCNGLDSHEEAGKSDVPVVVHIPSSVEPWFSVQDFGVGMSSDDIDNIYTVYFKSTKRKSNQYIGTKGLGCKSPYCITDSFTVTTIKDGKKYVYNMYLNEEHKPDYALMYEDDTNECNGVTVHIPLDSDLKIRNIIRECKEYFSYVSRQPTFIGAECTVERPKYALEDITTGVNSKQPRSYHHFGNYNCNVIMGEVVYPVVIGHLNGDVKPFAEYDIYLPIGAVEVHPSREQLIYDRRTKLVIERKIRNANRNYTHSIIEKSVKYIEEFGMRQFLSSAPIGCYYKNKDSLPFTFPNDTVFHEVLSSLKKRGYLKYTCDNMRINDICASTDVVAEHNIEYITYMSNSCISAPRKVSYRTSDTIRYAEVYSVVYINDLGRSAITKLQKYLTGIEPRSNNNNNGYANEFLLIQPTKKWKEFDEDKALEIALIDRDRVEIVYLSSIIENSNKPKKKSNLYGKVFQMDVDPLRISKCVWKTVEDMDNVDTMYYLPLNAFNVVLGNGGDNIPSKQYIEYMSGIIYLLGIHRIYGVRGDEIENIKKTKKCINLDNYIRENINDEYVQVMLKTELHGVPVALHGVSTYHEILMDEEIDMVERKKLYLLYRNLYPVYHRRVNAQWIIKEYIGELAPGNMEPIKELHKEFEEKYPLLSHIKGNAPSELVTKYMKDIIRSRS